MRYQLEEFSVFQLETIILIPWLGEVSFLKLSYTVIIVLVWPMYKSIIEFAHILSFEIGHFVEADHIHRIDEHFVYFSD